MAYPQNTVGTTLDGVLAALADLVARIDAGLGMRPAGVPVSADGPFYRMGEPIIVPVAPDSAGSPVQVTIPPGASCFRYVNPNPFSVRLAGTQAGQQPRIVTATTGWLWLPGSEGIYTSLMPILLSAMSVDGPFVGSDASQKAGVGVIELQYGTGN